MKAGDIKARMPFSRTSGIKLAARIDVEEVERAMDLDGYEIGAAEEERAYRLWCLDNTLFLNPLNDLGPHRIAARDILHLPPFVTPIDEPPALLGLFNRLKQEFVTARWLNYDGTRSEGVHFADRSVSLYNTLDYPTYSIAIEKVKAAYRLAVLALRQDRLLPQRLSGSEA